MQIHVPSNERLSGVRAEPTKLFHKSPLQIFIGKLAPTTSANWQFFTLIEYVNLNVRVFAVLVPRISTMLHQDYLQYKLHRNVCSVLLLRLTVERRFGTVQRDKLK